MSRRNRIVQEITMRVRFLAVLPALLALPLLAQAQPGRLVLPDFSGLAKKATESVNISLDPSLLNLAGGLLNADPSSSDSDVKSLISGVQGIYVRSYTFDRAGVYSKADVDAVRAQLVSPAWVPLVSTHDPQDDVDIYVRRSGKRTEGMAIITAEPKEFTIVNIVGDIDLAKLSQLQGKYGVPKIEGLGSLGAAGRH
ncbi:MAG TPA: DUF4252 domain-containing protein [Steroidobacteraceae bacterium]|nr:DUF4252 domain-containing protein [Steroidobacteraceae bacterium]